MYSQYAVRIAVSPPCGGIEGCLQSPSLPECWNARLASLHSESTTYSYMNLSQYVYLRNKGNMSVRLACRGVSRWPVDVLWRPAAVFLWPVAVLILATQVLLFPGTPIVSHRESGRARTASLQVGRRNCLPKRVTYFKFCLNMFVIRVCISHEKLFYLVVALPQEVSLKQLICS